MRRKGNEGQGEGGREEDREEKRKRIKGEGLTPLSKFSKTH